jgi:hypothetical protein
MMACYAGAGVVLMLVGKRWRQRREIRRVLAGRTTMFMDAQAANRDHGIAEREAILRQHCPDEEDAHRMAVAAEARAEASEDALVANGRPMDGLERVDEEPARRR